MTNNQKGFYRNIKYYHLMLFSIILSLLLIINSNNAKNKRINEKLDKEAEIKFNKILIGRHLESSNFEEGMEKICNKGTDELKDYYLTGALNKLGIDLDNKEENDEIPDYIYSLIDIVKSAKGGEGGSNISGSALEYGKHLKIVVVLLAIAILSIPGWICCCSCCCCNCCCCCCCKKGCCKLPFFIISTILYVLVVIVCIYGLSKSNSIFKGISDTECSILQFFNEVNKGETKEENPKWIGIEGIGHLLDEVKDKITTISEEKLTSIEEQEGKIKTAKQTFEAKLEQNSKNIIDTNTNYIEIINDDSIPFNYRLDITTKEVFGEFNATNRKADPENSFVGYWFKQYSTTAENSEKYIGNATEKFQTILQGDTITSNIDELKNSVNEIGDSISEISDGISDGILEYSDYIDNYGKLGFKIYFLVLIVIDALIAILMFLLCFFSGKLCNNCCCCRCIFKVLIHVLWNILALLMFITFLIAFIFVFVGTIGKDLVLVVNYLTTEENLNKEDNELFGEVGKKLGTCFNGDGNILEALNFNMDDMNSFDKLKDYNSEIEANTEQFTSMKDQNVVYNNIMNELNDRVNLSKLNFSIVSEQNSANPIQYTLSELVNNLNQAVSPEYWQLYCETGETNCHKLNEENVCNVYTNTGSNEYKIGQKIEAIKDLVKNANGEEIPSRTSFNHNFKDLTEELNNEYNTFLDEELGALEIFNSTIKDLTGIFDKYVGEDGGVFDFVNCKFIGKNIQVILNNLKNCLGGDLFTVGIWLFIAGCSMALSISFTILLIVIINSSVDDNKKAS